MKLGLIGAGNMGLALAEAWINKIPLEPKNLLIFDSNSERAGKAAALLEVRAYQELIPEISSCDVVVCAVKPQDAALACAKLTQHLRSAQLVLSVMAGQSLGTLRKMLAGHANLLRCMPNLPARLGMGVSVWYAAPGISSEYLDKAHNLLSALGSAIKVGDENLLDAATALSGTGPAYLYYLIDHFMHVAEELGFSASDAKEIIANTISGSVELWKCSQDSAKILRENVTSKAGTTAAAASVLDAAAWGGIFEDAVRAAYRRARELSGVFE